MFEHSVIALKNKKKTKKQQQILPANFKSCVGTQGVISNLLYTRSNDKYFEN